MMCTSSISYIIDRDNKKPGWHFKSPSEPSCLDNEPQQPPPQSQIAEYIYPVIPDFPLNIF
jgi:hypothetical protein